MNNGMVNTASQYSQYGQYVQPQPQQQNSDFSYSDPPLYANPLPVYYDIPQYGNFESQPEPSYLPSYLQPVGNVEPAIEHNYVQVSQEVIETNVNYPDYGNGNVVLPNYQMQEETHKPQPAENTNETSQIVEKESEESKKEEPKTENTEETAKFQLTNEFIKKNNLGNLVNLLVRGGSGTIEELRQKLNLIKK